MSNLAEKPLAALFLMQTASIFAQNPKFTTKKSSGHLFFHHRNKAFFFQMKTKKEC